MRNSDSKIDKTDNSNCPTSSEWERQGDLSLAEAQRRHERSRFQPVMTEEEHRRFDRCAYEHVHENKAAQLRKKRIAAASICASLLFVGLICYGVSKAISTGDETLAAHQHSEEQQANAQEQQQKFEAADNPGDIVIGVNGDADTYMLRGESYVEGGAHAAAADSGVLSQDIQAEGTVDTNTVGDYTITYRVQDSQGHVAKTERRVHVVENMDTMKTGVPVLRYHYVYNEDNPPEATNDDYLSSAKLDEELQYLKEENFYYPSFAEIQAFIAGRHSLPAKSVVLTFDDGEEETLGSVVSLIEKYDIPATSFMICSNADDAQRKIVQYASPYLEFESQSTSMNQAGGTVGQGGIISTMTKDEILSDLRDSSTVIGSNQAFAYPFGDTTAEGRQAVTEANIRCAFTMKNDWCFIGDDPTALNRVRISSECTMDGFAILTSEE